jgi:hypothetical protein
MVSFTGMTGLLLYIHTALSIGIVATSYTGMMGLLL